MSNYVTSVDYSISAWESCRAAFCGFFPPIASTFSRVIGVDDGTSFCVFYGTYFLTQLFHNYVSTSEDRFEETQVITLGTAVGGYVIDFIASKTLGDPPSPWLAGIVGSSLGMFMTITQRRIRELAQIIHRDRELQGVVLLRRQ